MSDFNLVTDPWIPVLTGRGSTVVTLEECLVGAHRYAGLALDSPLAAVALFRQVILPVYLDAVFQEAGCDPPADEQQWSELWSAQTLDRWPSWTGRDATSPAPIASYLQRYRDRFEVFGAEPFAQVAGLSTANGTTKPVSLLLTAAATGNNVPLFSARTDAEPPALTPGEAIRALLAAHCWDTAGIKSGAADDPQVKAGKTTGNQIGPLGAIGVMMPLGRTLAETVLLHVQCSSGNDERDRPQWRAAAQDGLAPRSAWSSRDPRGLLDLLTWQARRIRLVPERTPHGVLVRQVVLCAGDRMRTSQMEPHTAWRMSKQTKEQLPVRHTAGQAAWRGMLPMLAAGAQTTADGASSPVLRQIRRMQHDEQLPMDYPLRVLCVGLVYGTQNAVVEDAVVDLLPVPLAALDDGDVYQVVKEIVEQAEALRQAVNRLGDDLRAARGGDRLPWDKGQRAGDQMMHDLNLPAREALTALQRAPADVEEVRRTWTAAARRVTMAAAKSLIDSAPPQTFLGRVSRNQHPHRAATAELWFRVAVTKALGAPEPAPASGGTTL